jgi:uncharacterized membrane protein
VRNQRLATIVQALACSLWVGGGAILMAVAAPAAFRNAPDRSVAASIVGDMLSRWHVLAIAIPLGLLVFEIARRRDANRARLLLLSFALLLAAAQLAADMRIRSIRRDSSVAISSLERSDPVRRRFGVLHGASSILMLGQILLGAAVIGTTGNGERRS